MAHYLVCISGISDAIESVRGRLEESSSYPAKSLTNLKKRSSSFSSLCAILE